MNRETWQVTLAGEGGQGLLFMGMLLGETALKEGKNATQTASYGIASRGGFSKADVVVSTGEIWYPGVTKADLILVLSGEAMEKYQHHIPPDCLFVYDSDVCSGANITSAHHELIHPLPLTSSATALAQKRSKKVLVNMVSLGAVVELTGIVSHQGLKDIFKTKFSAALLQYNLEAVHCGSELSVRK